MTPANSAYCISTPYLTCVPVPQILQEVLPGPNTGRITFLISFGGGGWCGAWLCLMCLTGNWSTNLHFCGHNCWDRWWYSLQKKLTLLGIRRYLRNSPPAIKLNEIYCKAWLITTVVWFPILLTGNHQQPWTVNVAVALDYLYHVDWDLGLISDPSQDVISEFVLLRLWVNIVDIMLL